MSARITVRGRSWGICGLTMVFRGALGAAAAGSRALYPRGRLRPFRQPPGSGRPWGEVAGEGELARVTVNWGVGTGNVVGVRSWVWFGHDLVCDRGQGGVRGLSQCVRLHMILRFCACVWCEQELLTGGCAGLGECVPETVWLHVCLELCMVKTVCEVVSNSEILWLCVYGCAPAQKNRGVLDFRTV